MGFLELDVSSFSLSDVHRYPSSSSPPGFSPLILAWVGLGFPFASVLGARLVSVASLMRKLQRLHCGLAAAGCGAVYTEHLTIDICCVGVCVVSFLGSLSVVRTCGAPHRRPEAADVAKV